MQLRFKLAAIASTLTLIGGLACVGLATAGPAAAADNTRLCIAFGTNGSGGLFCATGSATARGNVTIGGQNSTAGSVWDSPDVGDTGQISLVGTGYCMDVNSSSNPQILTETCQGRPAERWTDIGSDTGFGGKTVPAYVYQSVAYPSLCLAAPASAVGPGAADVQALKCHFSSELQNWMQCVGSCTSTSSYVKGIPASRVALVAFSGGAKVVLENSV